MRVLVTGAFGFVGYAVAHALTTAGHDVTALSRRTPPGRRTPEGVTVVHADVRDVDGLRHALDGHTFDGVCHLAALARVRDSFDRPIDYFDTNVGGTANLVRVLNEAPEQPRAFVLASTGAVYGNAAGAISEAAHALPGTPYAASKRAAEQLVFFHARTRAMGTCVLRCFSISGAVAGVADGDDSRVLTRALHVAAGIAPSIIVNGDGSARRDFTHVLDVADAYVRAIEATQRGDERIYNVGTGHGVSVAGILETVETITSRPVTIEHQPPRDEPEELVADANLIRRELRWSASNSDLDRIVLDAWAATPTTVTDPHGDAQPAHTLGGPGPVDHSDS